ncbi:hypothetical protein [Embleya sp. NPDC050493]
MNNHGDGQNGKDGDRKQPPREQDGQWKKPIPPDSNTPKDPRNPKDKNK